MTNICEGTHEVRGGSPYGFGPFPYLPEGDSIGIGAGGLEGKDRSTSLPLFITYLSHDKNNEIVTENSTASVMIGEEFETHGYRLRLNGVCDNTAWLDLMDYPNKALDGTVPRYPPLVPAERFEAQE